MELLAATPSAWVRLAAQRFDEVLVDHAHCEKKAAAQALQKHVRQPMAERLLDRLLVSALIELRSQERLLLLSKHLPDADLRSFYARLADAEAGHGALFWRLAQKAAPAEAPQRSAELAAQEARIVLDLPIRAAIH